ncbi:MAG: SDR family NAD(P)-dependent oxidoreductase [Candidatus Onthomonas sp.]
MSGRKRAIVSGASSGIGRGVAFCLAKAGYDVAFSFFSHGENAAAVLEQLRQTAPGGRFFAIRADLSRKGEAVRFFREACGQLGGVELLVNNAGVTRKESIFELTEESMDHTLALDFRSYMLLMREAAVYMAGQGVRGSIVNITSTRAGRAYPTDAVYGAVKAAIERASESVALDTAPYGIRVNCIAPGATMRLTTEEMKAQADSPHVQKIGYLSPRIPLERYGTPEDIGQAVVYLASDEAAYITGATLRIDGGLALPGMPETAEEAASGWGARKPERTGGEAG